jgi:hypothetical protein
MANTYTLIASSTVGSGGAASIDFTSIPSTYTDLVLKYSVRQDLASVAASDFLYLNGSQTTYSGRWIEGAGSGTPSSYTTGATNLYGNGGGDGANATANTFANAEIYIPNYAGSTNKSLSHDAVMENNATTAYADLGAGLWSNTAAINRVTISTSATSVTGGTAKFVQYSTAYLYGVRSS